MRSWYWTRLEPTRRRCWASRPAGRSPPHARPGFPAASAASRSSRRWGRQDGLPAAWPPGNGCLWGWPGTLPAFVGWFLGRLAALARRSPRLFLSIATSELPSIDRRAIEQPGMRDAFLTSYLEAFRRGSWGAAQDLRVLTRPWGFQLGSIKAPTSIHYGDMDTTVPPQHARLYAKAIPGAQLHLYPGHGHFSILAAREILAALAG